MALILTLDDEPDACELMQRILSAMGHEVRAFTDSRDALEWLDRNSPDLALLDVRLRGADGLGVLELIRKRHPDAKAMIVTGYPSAETQTRASELGVEDFVVKPIEIDDLERRVTRALGLIL